MKVFGCSDERALIPYASASGASTREPRGNGGGLRPRVYSAFGLRRSLPRPLLDRPSSHDALEILKRDPAAEFSGPNPNRRRPSQLDQLGVSVPAPDRHGGDAKLFLHLRIGDKRVVVGRVVGLDEGGVGGHGAAPFLERGTTPINRIRKIVGLGPGTIFAPVFG